MSKTNAGGTEGDGTVTKTEKDAALDLKSAKYFEAEPRLCTKLDVAGRSHPGLVRPNNEDHFLVVRRYRGREILITSLPKELLNEPEDHTFTLAVADGMGGRQFGDVASLLALLTGWELGGDEIKWSVKMNPREEDDLRKKAEVCFRLINRALHDLARENPRMAGMGTTLTLCHTTGRELFVMHAGDSRAYLHRAGTLKQLTRDHNMAQFLVDHGAADPGSPEARKMKHILTNVLGGPDQDLAVDVEHHRLSDGDTLLLCTDGLNDMATDAEISQTLDAHASSSSAETCLALEDLALSRGARDNVTVVVARYTFTPEPSFAERMASD